jgi:hypothetical protein
VITGLRPSNFRCYPPDWTCGPLDPFLPLGRITVILAPNSGGKTTLLNQLLAMRQSWGALEGFKRLVTAGPELDLGPFSTRVPYLANLNAPTSLSFRILRAAAEHEDEVCFEYIAADEAARSGWLRSVIVTRKNSTWTLERDGEDGALELGLTTASGDAATEAMAPEEGASDQAARPDKYIVDTSVDGETPLLFESANVGNGYRRDPNDFEPAESTPAPNISPKTAKISFAHGLVSVADHLEPAWTAIHGIRQELLSLRRIGPLRESGARVSPVSAVHSDYVGSSGEFTASVLFNNAQTLGRANSFLEILRLPTLEARGVPDTMMVQLVTETGATVADLGFGVSQVLPILTQLAVPTHQTVWIEQPELHLHPLQQAMLARVIANALDREPEDLKRESSPDRETSDRQFIFETHSEHLVLALCALVRARSIRPDDLCLLAGTSGANGPQFERIPVDDDGEMTRPWPGGFFPERRSLSAGRLP